MRTRNKMPWIQVAQFGPSTQMNDRSRHLAAAARVEIPHSVGRPKYESYELLELVCLFQSHIRILFFACPESWCWHWNNAMPKQTSLNCNRFNTGLWIMQTPVGVPCSVLPTFSHLISMILIGYVCQVVSHRDCIEMGIGGKALFCVQRFGTVLGNG